MIRIAFIFIVGLFTVLSATAGLDEALDVYLTFDNVKREMILDASGNGLDAEIVGNPQFVRGKYGDAIQSAAVTEDCVTLPAADALNINGEITLSAWISRDNWTEGSGYWFEKGVYAAKVGLQAYGMAVFQVEDADWDLGHLKGTVLVMILGTPGGRTSSSGVLPKMENKTWHHVVGTYDGAFMKMYLDGEVFFDGQEFGFPPTEVPADGNNQALRIGCAKDRLQFAFDKGAIDEVAIWHRVLTQAEIRTVLKGHLLSVSPRDKAATTWGDMKRRRATYETR